MGRVDDFKKKLESYTWTADYLNYINYRQSGLKDKAKQALSNFIGLFPNQKEAEKRGVLNVVFHMAFLSDDYTLYLPFNLYNSYLVPCINKWIVEEPENYIPFMWSSDFENNKKAITLNASDQISLLNFATKLINKVGMNQHEISSGYPYDGDPIRDIKDIEFFEPYIDNIKDNKEKERIKDCIQDLKHTAELYKS